MKYAYIINLEERGEFYADVRENDENGASVLEVFGDAMTEDGYMQHSRDIDGLVGYMVDMGLMEPGDALTLGASK